MKTSICLVATAGLLACLSGCGTAPIPTNCVLQSCEVNATRTAQSADDKVDEEKPPFAEVQPPASTQETPAPQTSVAAPVGTPLPEGSAGFGVNSNLSCEDYVASFWKVGAQTYEEAPGPFLTTLKFTATVLSINGSTVSINTKLVTPDASQNVDENLSFDACDKGYQSVIPTTKGECLPQLVGNENVTVNGKLYAAKKYQFTNCTSTDDKNFTSIVWRADGIPLWGVIKREVSGTLIPAELNNKVSAQTKSWLFN